MGSDLEPFLQRFVALFLTMRRVGGTTTLMRAMMIPTAMRAMMITRVVKARAEARTLRKVSMLMIHHFPPEMAQVVARAAGSLL